MTRLIFFLALVWALPSAAMGPWQRDTCHLEVPCALGDRSYHVKEPDGWDGETPMPVLIHFHGWQRTGALPVQHQRISGATRRRGVLLIAPNGNRKTWNMWSPETEDVQFAADVLEDVIKRYPVDTDNIYLSGYSYGSIMAWRVACDRGTDMNVRALLGISGTIDLSEDCAQSPREARHVHGLNDNVLDFPYGPDGDTTYPVSLWRDHLGCTDARTDGGDWAAVEFLSLSRTEWQECEAGIKVTLDVHPGGHFIPHGWIARQLDELLGREPVYP
ncbi:polyhydroxybutyrate depolymerase [uncultured Tateyamaria sp.]|uniref:alpha/beta hydrolase family esterase n=1 Tax=uncultured Tateyamaria sp. TaxID=455651 RepID=UPI0026226946|nr:polyhydroxybutyrate depolymerase [uncultured Tateyamaria sp.]